jgi:hypothetical protein
LTDGLNAPGRMVVQRLDCGGAGVFTVSIEVFSPRNTANRLFTEQRRLTGMAGADDVESQPVDVPGSPAGAWRLFARTNPVRIAATTLWIEGKPATLGLMARAHQAWRSVAGSRYSPVLVVVMPERALEDTDMFGRRRLAESLVTFLRSQPGLPGLITRISGSAPVKG